MVDRTVTSPAPNVPDGFDVALGSPAVASRWLVPTGSPTSADQATLIVTNPSATRAVKVRLTTQDAGTAAPLAGTDRVVTIPAGGRGGFPVPSGAKSPQVALEVDGDGPLVVEERLAFTGGGQSSSLAIPVAPTATVTWTGRFQ